MLSVAGANLPAAGGGYFRHFPYSMTHAALRAYERRGLPGVFYIHPWEIDPLQPRLAAPALQRLRHYGGIAGARERLLRLVADFRFTSIAGLLRSSREASVDVVSAYAS